MSLPYRPATAALALTALYLGVLAAMRFHLCLNDFWAFSFLARSVDLADPATLHNGFMPPGYALFLKSLGPAREIAGAFVLSLVAVFLTAWTVARIAGRHGAVPAALLSVLLLAIYPPFLQSGLTAGPDIVVVALVSVAWALHGRADASVGQSLLAGSLLGLALLLRAHALFAGLGIGFAVAVFERRFGRREFALGAGLAAGLALQVAVNLAAGASPWATSQAFNIYKMVHGVDWFAPVDPARLSVLQIVRDAPMEFLREWSGAIARAGAWLAGPALVPVVLRGAPHAALRRQATLALLAGAVYTVPVALGDSPRTAVMLSALLVPPVAGLLVGLRRKRGSVAGLFAAALLAFGLIASLRADRDFLRLKFSQAQDFAAVEEVLQRAGALRADEVFSDDFDLYFRSLEGRRPLTKGGWGLIGIDGWAGEFAQLPTGDTATFLEACRAHDVRYLALTRRVRRMGPSMAVLRYDPRAAGATVIAECGAFLVVAVGDAPSPTP